MTLREKQSLFVKLVAILINYAYDHGYELTFGETYRPLSVASLYAKLKKGIINSLHSKRLAIDFNLFRNGEWLTKSDDHKELGVFWELLGKKYDVETVWGGRFGDGNHYSIEHNGIK